MFCNICKCNVIKFGTNVTNDEYNIPHFKKCVYGVGLYACPVHSAVNDA